ncbi:MAG: isoprenyl transferase [Candidatus Omnitrophota bacterium]
MIDKNNLPRHVAIIMDGNGRWAKEKGLPRTAGHREGIKRVREIVKVTTKLGIEMVTFFAFSTENWSRPKKEVGMLMLSLGYFLKHEVKELNKNNVRLRIVGRQAPFPEKLVKNLREAERRTKDNTGCTMILALNYGSRQEIVDAAKKFATQVLHKESAIQDLDEERFSEYLYTTGLPDPDLLIRTSGEMRISNFFLWQLSYAELYFSRKYWPDFKEEDFTKAIEEYQKRERRFGGIHADKADH